MKNVNALVINPTSTFPSSSMAQINLTLHYPTPTPRYHFLKNTIVLFLFCSNSHKLTASQRKGEDHSGRAKTHLTGIINHGHWESYAFISGEEYYHNSNLNIECLQRVFAHVIRKYNRLPDHLFVQMDNCSRFHLYIFQLFFFSSTRFFLFLIVFVINIGCRDNKNNYLIAFFDFLVQTGMFKSVELSFMMTGHTHEVAAFLAPPRPAPPPPPLSITC